MTTVAGGRKTDRSTRVHAAREGAPQPFWNPLCLVLSEESGALMDDKIRITEECMVTHPSTFSENKDGPKDDVE